MQNKTQGKPEASHLARLWLSWKSVALRILSHHVQEELVPHLRAMGADLAGHVALHLGCEPAPGPHRPGRREGKGVLRLTTGFEIGHRLANSQKTEHFANASQQQVIRALKADAWEADLLSLSTCQKHAAHECGDP